MDQVCRTCLKVSENLDNLFNDTDLPHKIETISSVQVSLSDNLPSKICDQCARNVHLLYDFRSIIIRSNIILKKRYSTSIKNENKTDLNTATANTYDSQVKSEQPCPEEEITAEVNVDTNNERLNPVHNLEKVDFDSNIKITNVETISDVLEETRYSCKRCKFSSTVYSEWRTHKKKHICPKAICSICGKTIRADNLKKHISTHTESPVKCKYCGKTCKNTGSLRSHVLIHRNVRLQCNTCGKVYTHRSGFRQHIKRHTLGDIRTVACSICTKLFYDKRALERHIRSHTGERPYPCEYCKKGFSSSNALKTHKRRHTNEKPYVCEFCPMAFPQKVSLRTHRKSKHPEATDL